MADDEVTPQAGELTTANYGWVKPTVGASDDAWGGYINTDLDGIDSTVKSVSTVANAAYPASNPSGYQTAAQVTASLGNYLPLAGGTLTGALVGTTAAFSGATSGASFTGAAVVVSGAAGSSRSVWGQTAGANRWAINLGDSSAESTGNAGSNLVFYRFNDAGTFIDTSLSVERKTGIVTIPNLSAPQALGDNRIINGDMRIDQRNNGAGGSGAQLYTIDRWKYNANLAAKGNYQRAASACPGFPYHLAFVSASAYTAAIGDYFMWFQPVEADMIGDFQWGTANAQPVTLSFWVYVSQAGTYAGSIRNDVPNRCYVFTFVPTANTWSRIVVTIPGDTGGTWTLSGNGVGLYLSFDLGSGGTFKIGSLYANSWQAGNYVGMTGAVNVVATNGAAFHMTGVKLEVGSVATPFNRQTMAKSLADCQRYYCVMNTISNLGYAQNIGAGYGYSIGFPTSMRATPTINFFNISYTNTTGLTAANTTADAVFLYASSTVAGGGQWTTAFTASAEL